MTCTGRQRFAWRVTNRGFGESRPKVGMNRGWSIERIDWEGLEQALSDSGSWSSVLLTTNDKLMVPTRPGVYAICAQPPSAVGPDQTTIFHNLASPLYVGRSESNIRSRFLAHCRADDPELRRAKRCYQKVSLRFWFVELPANAIKDAEAWLIRCFGPPVNKRAGTITGTLRPPIDA